MQYVLPSLPQSCTTYSPAVVTTRWWSAQDIMRLLTTPSSHHMSCSQLKLNLEAARKQFRCRQDLLPQEALMQVAQLVTMIICKPGQMAVVSSCQGWTWHWPRKSFMVILRSLWYPPRSAIDLCGRRGCRQLWSSRAHLQKNQQRQRGNHWN